MSVVTKDSTNIIKSDPELSELLKKLELIKTARTFSRWKNSFLGRLESFLDDANINSAKTSYKNFSCKMGTFVKMINDVNGHVEKGQLQVEQYTVKAKLSLNEMSKTLTIVIQMLEALIPQTAQLEVKSGYNKFHIGAVLVRDNFSEYGRLESCKDILHHMRTVSLNEVADKQILEEMDNFATKLKKFCEIMADLGLYEVMMKCMEFAEDNGPDLSSLIFMDCKTGGIGEIPREDAMTNRIISIQGTDSKGHDVIAEAATTDEMKEKLLKIINENPRLNIGFGVNKNQYDEDSVTITELEKVQNMWGVKLKKTPKNVKGEELIFVCQTTSQFGELSRKNTLESGLLTEIKDPKTKKIILEEAYMDFEERSEIVEKIRSLLKLGIQ